jgi:Na+-translocating ferredoxin:NAD+ oxidoreductase RnfG subunit
MLSKLAITLCVLTLCLALAQTCPGAQLLTKEEAFKAVFGEGCEITEEQKELTGEPLVRVLNALGGSLTYEHGKAPTTVDASAGEETVPLTFYRAVKDGQTVGVALIDSQPGKWGEVKFMIAFNEDGSVSKVVVMSSSEKRGRGLSRASFLKQYEGKTADSELQVRKDITGIAGATISSECATFAVKRAVLVYAQLYLKAGEMKGGDDGGDAAKGEDAAKADDSGEGGDAGE